MFKQLLRKFVEYLGPHLNLIPQRELCPTFMNRLSTERGSNTALYKILIAV